MDFKTIIVIGVILIAGAWMFGLLSVQNGCAVYDTQGHLWDNNYFGGAADFYVAHDTKMSLVKSGGGTSIPITQRHTCQGSVWNTEASPFYTCVYSPTWGLQMENLNSPSGWCYFSGQNRDDCVGYTTGETVVHNGETWRCGETPLEQMKNSLIAYQSYHWTKISDSAITSTTTTSSTTTTTDGNGGGDIPIVYLGIGAAALLGLIYWLK